MKVLAIFSGGMDSATAIAWAQSMNHKVATVSFDYGSKHNDVEYLYAQELCAHYDIATTRIPLPFIGEYFKSDLLKSGGEIPEGHYEDPSMKKTVVPLRNGIMLTIAAGLAESWGFDAVMIGNHAGDHAIYPDCRVAFITHMANAIDAGTYSHVRVLSPLRIMTKQNIVSMGARLKVPYQLTYSCYKGGDKHCGKCGTCYERKEAFRLAGVTDPTEYEA